MPPQPELPRVETAPGAPEAGVEAPETAGAGLEAPETAEKPVEAQPAPSPAVQATPAPAKDETTRRVEGILEEGLKDAYVSMPPEARKRFKAEGERVASEITKMIRSLKVAAGKVLKLIRGWLKMIPGVNKHYLAQEAKIKTDRILAAAEEEKSRRGGSVL